MCTEVKHGPNPEWSGPTFGEFSLTITGHYSNIDHVIYAGVSRRAYRSNRPVKQQAELLGLRTAFLRFFIQEWQELGGTQEEALEEIEQICDTTRDRVSCRVTPDGERLVPIGAPRLPDQIWP